jgi:hypothetical protein
MERPKPDLQCTTTCRAEKLRVQLSEEAVREIKAHFMYDSLMFTVATAILMQINCASEDHENHTETLHLR